MAFLATEDRFGPDLNRYRQGEPNPCTYTPVELPVGKQLSGTFGYHRPEHPIPPSHFVAAAAASPAIATTLKALEENSLQHLRETSKPNVCSYSPTVEGQFPRAYTMKEILAERKRAALQRNKDTMAAQELHLGLGPGSYEVNRDTNQEMVATPFTFTHEKRHGILENNAALGRIGCSPGPGLYRVESSTAGPSASAVASTAFRSKHAAAFITRVRSDNQLHQHQKKDAAMYSKELAKSYRELSASVERLGKRLASPDLREQTFQRFGKNTPALEAYRRGPGCYDSRHKLNEDENGKCDCFQLSPLRRKPANAFGSVAGRDLLTSMISAGHTSAHTIGPGIYDAYSSSFILPTHNLTYKQEMQRTNPKIKSRNRRRADSEADDESRLTQREMWKVMRHGPTLPS
ncbi:hypothetical protein JG688_00007703 [Phytophthora aleatoria]|uniref:Uncharacterized protein n=1 Tax=Phytophthora aleatoria TaxID=2496075 RepID=A0A8J5J5M5_9STRA|nr:hypothetical protein JG688_00007703 [Phytophthora aleatoria]